jgi:AcrR family transcriptional regulator
MSKERKTSEARDKDLRLAISRIERGRTVNKATKLTIASVAREAGVSTALIHNCHPDIAEIVREAQGRSSRAQRDAKRQELKAERDKARVLRDEIAALRSQVAKLASINEVLLAENRALKVRSNDPTVVDLASKSSRKNYES